jgi:uncharacterized protein YcfJ
MIEVLRIRCKISTMKALFINLAVSISSASLASTALAQHQETGRVLSSTPIVQQVAVPRQVCTVDQASVQPQQRSGAGALLGAIAGGAMGNAVGDGGGRAAATIIGLIGGAIIGERVEHASPQPQRPIQQCSTQYFYENRATAYNVVYEYAGKQYSVQLPYDPGPTIKLQILPAGMSNSSLDPSQAPPAAELAVAPVYVNPPVVAVQRIYFAEPAYAVRHYHPPLSLSFGFGSHRGHRHHHHWR